MWHSSQVTAQVVQCTARHTWKWGRVDITWAKWSLCDWMWFVTYLTGDNKISSSLSLLRAHTNLSFLSLYTPSSFFHFILFHLSRPLHFAWLGMRSSFQCVSPVCRPSTRFWWSSIDGNIKNKQPCGRRWCMCVHCMWKQLHQTDFFLFIWFAASLRFSISSNGIESNFPFLVGFCVCATSSFERTYWYEWNMVAFSCFPLSFFFIFCVFVFFRF